MKKEFSKLFSRKVDFKDSKELTIKLKSNLKWHDGKPITAEDVLFTFNTVLDEKQNSPSRQYLLVGEKPVKVEKIDDLTVKITLPTASESFYMVYLKFLQYQNMCLKENQI